MLRFRTSNQFLVTHAAVSSRDVELCLANKARALPLPAGASRTLITSHINAIVPYRDISHVQYNLTTQDQFIKGRRIVAAACIYASIRYWICDIIDTPQRTNFGSPSFDLLECIVSLVTQSFISFALARIRSKSTNTTFHSIQSTVDLAPFA